MEVVDREEGADAAHLQLSEVGVGGRGTKVRVQGGAGEEMRGE